MILDMNVNYVCDVLLAGTDKKLAILLEGESLLNDGAALVFFTVFLQMARGEYKNNDSKLASSAARSNNYVYLYQRWIV